MIAIIQRSLGPTSLRYAEYEGHFDGPGLVVLLGWEKSDETHQSLDEAEEWILSRIHGLRIFPDKDGKMNVNLADYKLQSGAKESGILWVSQFTLTAKLDSGFRPSFTESMSPDMARTRYAAFIAKCRNTAPEGVKTLCGAFGADMSLSFTNWGPVTIPLKK